MHSELLKSYPGPDYDSYALLLNVDESILNLNPDLKKLGCVIEQVSIKKLEQNFSELFGIRPDHTSQFPLMLENGESVSVEFYNALMRNSMFGPIFPHNNSEFYFLKRLENFCYKKHPDFEHISSDLTNLHYFAETFLDLKASLN